MASSVHAGCVAVLFADADNFASNLYHLHNTSLTSAQSELPRRVDLILFVLAVQETDNMLWELLSRDSSSFLNVDRTLRVLEEIWRKRQCGCERGLGVRKG